MKAFLMYRDRDFDPREAPPPGAADLVQDLGLEVLVQAMRTLNAAPGQPAVRPGGSAAAAESRAR